LYQIKKLHIAMWVFNFLRAVGGVASMIRDLVAKEYWERGAGVSLIFSNLFISAFSFRWHSSVGFIVSINLAAVGMVVFIANGAFVMFKQRVYSLAVVVTVGCYNYSDFIGTCESLVSMQQVHPSTTGDVLLQVSWYISSILLLPATYVVFSMGLSSICTCTVWYASPNDAENRFIVWFTRHTQIFALLVICVGGTLCVAAAVMDSKAQSILYYDCRNAAIGEEWPGGPVSYNGCVANTVVFPGSVTGFWGVWVKYKLAVAQSIVAW
jgi:hypothetical protein